MKALSIVVLGLGGCLALGATGEVVLALEPSLLPSDALEVPFLADHQTSWTLRAWMLGSNLVNLVCAITLVRAALAIGRADARGWRWLRGATGVLAGIALVGIAICLPHLLPLATDADQFMLASVVGAGLGLAAMCLVLFRRAQRAISSPA